MNISVKFKKTIMEEILLRFPNIGDNIFKELDSEDFCKSKEVGRSWSYFINNERALQKSYKNHIKNKIQSLTEELRQDNNNWGNQTPFHLAAERGYLPVCRQIMENIDEKIGLDILHIIRQLKMVTCQFVSSLLKMLMTRIRKAT